MSGNEKLLPDLHLENYTDKIKAQTFAVESSRTTHGASECLDACLLFCNMLLRALAGGDKQQVLFADADLFDGEAKIKFNGIQWGQTRLI